MNNHKHDGLQVISTELLKEPEYYKKNEIEGRKHAVTVGLKDFGMLGTLTVNMYPGREYVVIDGVQILRLCKERGINKVPVFTVSLPLEKEKQAHGILSQTITHISKEQLQQLYDEETFNRFFNPLLQEIINPVLNKAIMEAAGVEIEEKHTISVSQFSIRLRTERKRQLEMIAKNFHVSLSEAIDLLVSLFVEERKEDLV